MREVEAEVAAEAEGEGEGVGVGVAGAEVGEEVEAEEEAATAVGTWVEPVTVMPHREKLRRVAVKEVYLSPIKLMNKKHYFVCL